MPNRRLTLAAIEAERRLREQVRQTVERRWVQFAGLSDEEAERWLDAIVPFIEASQRASSVTTEAVLAAQMGRSAPGLDRDQILAAVRGDATTREVYERPIITARGAVAEGRPWAEAMNAGLARATTTAATDMQLVFRGTCQAAQAEGLVPYGFQRVADAEACDFCLLVDGAFVKSADAMALHGNCGCGLEPLDAPRAPSKVPSGVAVHNHGELGPVLADPAHDFTTI